jgi:tetratricopeptide (TPR) repeat protein
MVARIPEKRHPAHPRLAAALIFALTLAVFWPAVRGEFLQWDDDVNLTANPHLRGLDGASVKWMFTDAAYMRRYVPLAWLGWAVEKEAFGLTAVSAHAGNVLFHAINAVLVFFLVRRLAARHPGGADRPAMFAALAGAAIWALHPLRVEVVAWASGRMYAQGACFALLGVLAYLRAADEPDRRWRWRWLGLSLAAFAVSILTYPVFVPAVALLPLIDAYALRRFEPGVPWWRGARHRAIWLEKIPFLGLAGAIALVTIAARAQAQGLWAPPPTLAEFPPADRIAQAGYVWAHYVWRPFVPVGLAPVYTTLVEFDPRSAAFVLSGAGVAAATALLWWRRARWPGVWALWLAHLILIAPMLGLAEHPHYANDRYSYFQGALGALAAAGLLRAGGRFAFGAGGAAGMALAALSVAQIGMWRDSETLFRRLLDHVGVSEYRADIAMRLGDVLWIKGRFTEARARYEESLRILPQVTRAAVPHTGLARMAAAEGRGQEAADRYGAAVRLDPNFWPAWSGLGELLLAASRWPEAVAALERAVALNGGDATARELLGAALVQARRPAEAVAQLEAALRLRPGTLGTACNLVVALADAGRRDEAIALGQRIATQVANSAQAHFALGHALRAAGKNAEAAAALTRALELQPDHAAAREALAALRAL